MNKQAQFIEWLCGKNVPFPFYQDIEDVDPPIRFTINKQNNEHLDKRQGHGEI